MNTLKQIATYVIVIAVVALLVVGVPAYALSNPQEFFQFTIGS